MIEQPYVVDHAQGSGDVRRHVARVLAEQSVPDEDEVVQVVTWELVANARAGGAERIEVWVVADEGIVRVEVRDDGPGMPEPAAELDALGRRLRLVDEVSRAWGLTPLGACKAVWCEIVVTA
jgi:anti-sigma regulatory factor (Ser/Thr protein kinase)